MPEEVILDGESDSRRRTIWSRLGKMFGHDDEPLEKAILEASATGTLEPDEESMLLGILQFDKLLVHDTMIPRTDIDCVPEDSSIAEVVQMIVDSGHSRIPVYRGTRDNIVGILHAKDLLGRIVNAGTEGTAITDVMREPFFVPETKNVRSLLEEFRGRKQHIAIALDEYGGTSGLITIEDVLEEIVGDIEDEHDAPKEEEIRPLEDGAFELTGRALLEDLQDIGIDIESDEVDTIGGYLSMEAGHVPDIGEDFVVHGWRFTVLDADKKLIRRIRAEVDVEKPEAQ
jgi:magnesium and cobalt transporter